LFKPVWISWLPPVKPLISSDQRAAKARDFSLVMQTNFRDIDFADDTLSPTSKQLVPGGWQLAWQYSNLVSGFQIGMTMPEKLQPGPLAGEISYAAPVSLFFFFFLMLVAAFLFTRLGPYRFAAGARSESPALSPILEVAS